MTERLSPRPGSLRRRARRSAPRSPGTHGRDGDLPPVPAAELPPDDDPTILGFPAELGEDDEVAAPLDPETYPVDLVVVRHPDRIACALLVLAGVAANVSLSLAWLHGEGTSGLSLVWHGVDRLDAGVQALVRSSLWQPLAVVLAGGLLVLLGFLLLVPARAHRLLGVLALLIALGSGAAVLDLLAGASWRLDLFGPGTWFAAAVPVLGVLGALKAMLTPPDVEIAPR